MAKLLKFLISIVLLGFLFANVAQNWNAVSGILSGFKVLPLIVSFLFLLLVYPEGAFCWWVVLQRMGIKASLTSAICVWIISNTSRYIPGTIWQYIGRVELVKREIGVPRNKTIVSLLVEIFLVLSAGVFVAAFSPVKLGWWLFLLPVPLLLLHPTIANKIIALIAKISKKEIGRFNAKLSFSDTISSFPWFVLNFLINGAALSFLVVSLGQKVGLVDFFAFAGFYALSWMVGYLAVFAPAGLGVTEVTLSYLLSFNMPLVVASVIALSYRFFLTITELLIFITILLVGGKRNDREY